MKYEISKMIANKKKYVFHIIMFVFILISLTISIVGSVVIYQYQTTKENFVDNSLVKNIEISSYTEKGNKVRKLSENDVKNIKNILNEINKSNRIIIEYFINFGIPTNKDETVFLKSFSDNLFLDDVLNNKKYNDGLITKNDFLKGKIVLNIPIIKMSNNGFESDKNIKKMFKTYKLDQSSSLNNYMKKDELLVPKEVFDNIVKTMFPQKKYTDIEKIYVNLNSIEDVKPIANLLSKNNYNVSHAFEYYNNLDGSIDKILKFSIAALVILLVFTICILVGLFELMLKNAVGDIAILKHLGFEKNMINKIYINPMILRCIFSLLILLICNILLYNYGVINSIYTVMFYQFIYIILWIVVLVVMLWRVNYYSSKDVLVLMKQYKVEE